MYLTAEFEQKASVIRVLSDLKTGGVSADDVNVFSDAPLELPRSVLERRSHMSLAVVAGAIACFLVVVGLVYFIQYNYRIDTGGMPTFSFWATGVVFYELTMLGAILTSLFWFIHESRILRRNRPARPQFQKGGICLQVRCERDRVDFLGGLLKTAGASNFQTTGDE